MAGDWLKMRGNLWDDPRVGRLCDMTDSTEGPVIGALYWLWATADQHTEDGFLPGLTLRQIDRKTALPGFGAALCEIGWLQDGPNGVTLVRFEEHNGASAKRRCTDAQRKASVRVVSASNADKQQTQAGQLADEMRRPAELEKRREDIKAPPIVPPGDIPSGVDQPKPKRAKREAVTLDIYRAAGGKLIRGEDDPVWEYCETIGLPHDFVRLAGHEFLARFSGTKKLQADWPAHFRNAIRANWFRLWFQAGDGWELTTAGHQAKRMQREAS